MKSYPVMQVFCAGSFFLLEAMSPPLPTFVFTSLTPQPPRSGMSRHPRSRPRPPYRPRLPRRRRHRRRPPMCPPPSPLWDGHATAGVGLWALAEAWLGSPLRPVSPYLKSNPTEELWVCSILVSAKSVASGACASENRRHRPNPSSF